MPSITVTRLSDGKAIYPLTAQLRRDLDAWTWQLSLAVATREDYDALTPDTDGNGPVAIEVTVNGYTWHFLIERVSRQARFPAPAFQTEGRGKAALLTAPYAATSSRSEANPYNASQLADHELQNTGWTLVWTAQDWLVPADTFSYANLTPLGVILQLAATVGATVHADKADQVLRVAPRWPTAPWAWPPGAADRILPDYVATNLALAWQPAPQYNTIHVIGSGPNGVMVKGTITGTGGTLPAPQVTDPLLCHIDAGRARAAAELAKSGNSTRASLNLPLYPDGTPPALIEPGHTVQIEESDETTWIGLCTATTITASRTSALAVRQTIEIQRPHWS